MSVPRPGTSEEGKGPWSTSHHKDRSNVVLCYSDSYLTMVRAPDQHFSCSQEFCLGEEGVCQLDNTE